MTPYPKRIIEVDLPIARISAHARAEKNSRVAHIPRLHIYPAARPLAACRAVILASLWPDPVDLMAWLEEAGGKEEIRAPRDEDLKPGEGVVIRPKRFLDEARSLMAKWATRHSGKASAESYHNLIMIQKDAGALDDPAFLRTVLLDFIADFANWDNSTDADYLATSRALVQAAHEALGGESDGRPVVIDPFAGGGAFPLECLRVGLAPVATDLNPLAVALNYFLLQALPRYGSSIREHIHRWLRHASSAAENELRPLYPKGEDSEEPVAYLWARVIVSEAPSDGGDPVEIPLIRSMQLTRGRSGGDWFLRWKRDGLDRIVADVVDRSYSNGTSLRVRVPQIEIVRSSPKHGSCDAGTTRGGSVTCPITGYTHKVAQVRCQLAARRGGSDDGRLYCVVADHPTIGRRFRSPSQEDLNAILRAASHLKRVESYEGETLLQKLPPEGTNGFRVQKYGMGRWRDVFTTRQLSALERPH